MSGQKRKVESQLTGRPTRSAPPFRDMYELNSSSDSELIDECLGIHREAPAASAPPKVKVVAKPRKSTQIIVNDRNKNTSSTTTTRASKEVHFEGPNSWKRTTCSPTKVGHRPRKAVAHPTSIMYLVLEDAAFPVPKEFLVAVSPFFKFAFDNPFDGSNSDRYAIGNVDASAVTIFVEWLYSRELRRPCGQAYSWPNHEIDLLLDDGIVEDDKQMKRELINLFILADLYDVPQLRRDVIDAFMGICSTSFPDPKSVNKLCEHVSFSSCLVRFLVDWFSYSWDGSNLQYECEEYPSQFLVAILKKIVQAPGRQPRRSPLLNPCDYHEHGAPEKAAAPQAQTDEETQVVEETQLKD